MACKCILAYFKLLFLLIVHFSVCDNNNRDTPNPLSTKVKGIFGAKKVVSQKQEVVLFSQHKEGVIVDFLIATIFFS